MDADPMEGSSFSNLKDILKVEIELKVEDDDCPNVSAHNLDDYVFSESEIITDPTSGQVICLHCLEELHPETVVDHMVTEHKYRKIKFKCWNCETCFKERIMLMAHRESCQPKKHQKKSIQTLIKEATDSNDVICPICLVEVGDDLKGHALREHSKPPGEVRRRVEQSAKCKICSKTFKSKVTMSQHVKLVHQSVQDSVECHICKQTFSSDKYLANHLRNVHPTGNKVHRCETCLKIFKNHQSLYQHQKNVHLGNKKHRCETCLKFFKNHQSLYQHKKNMHLKTKGKKVQINVI